MFAEQQRQTDLEGFLSLVPRDSLDRDVKAVILRFERTALSELSREVPGFNHSTIEREMGQLTPGLRALTRLVIHSANKNSHKYRLSKERIGTSIFDINPAIISNPPTYKEQEYHESFDGAENNARIKIHRPFNQVSTQTRIQEVNAWITESMKVAKESDEGVLENRFGCFAFSVGGDVDVVIEVPGGGQESLFQVLDAQNDWQLYLSILEKIGPQSRYIGNDGRIIIRTREATAAQELYSGLTGLVSREQVVELRPLTPSHLAFMMFGRHHALVTPTDREKLDKLVAKYSQPEEWDQYLSQWSDTPTQQGIDWRKIRGVNGGIQFHNALLWDPEFGIIESIDGVGRNEPGYLEKVRAMRSTVLGDPEHLNSLLENIMTCVADTTIFDRKYTHEQRRQDQVYAAQFSHQFGCSKISPLNPFSLPAIDFTLDIQHSKPTVAIAHLSRHHLHARSKRG